MPKRVYIPTNKMPVEPDLNSTLENEGFYDPITGARYAGETEARPRQNWMIEPDLTSTLTGNYDVPEGAYIDPMGRVKFKDTGEELKIIRRPNLLPLVETPQGAEFVMPKLVDIVGNVMGGVAAPVKGAGTVLGSGPVLRATEKAIEKIPAFFSPVENAIAASKQTKADAQQWLGYLKNQQGVKADELEHLGLNNLSGSLTKEELLAKVKEGQPQINEVWKGKEKLNIAEKELKNAIGDGMPFGKGKLYSDEVIRGLINEDLGIGDLPEKFQGLAKNLIEANKQSVPTKYHGYQLPGGENYREMLLTLPVNEKGFNASTMSDIAKELGYGGWTSSLTSEQKAHVERIFDNQKMNPSKRFERMNEIENELQNRRTGEEDKRAALRQEYKELSDMERKSPSYKSSHWDEPNVLAHIRMNDRTVDGKKSLHIEEIQSDWHQQGRKQGYASSKDKAEFDRLHKELEEARSDLAHATDKKSTELLGMSYQKYRSMYPNEKETALKNLKEYRAQDVDYVALEKKVEDLEKARNAVNPVNGVPDAPFKKSWDELALKKAIRHAAENNYDQISWTPGEAQAARYDLSKQIDRLHFNKNSDDTFDLSAEIRGNKQDLHKAVPENKLADYVGKEAATKIVKKFENYKGKETAGSLENVDLKVGGEGMKGFYDKMLVDKANALGKKFGVKVEKGETIADNNGWHITPPTETTSKKWMVKSNDYNSKGTHFDTETEAKEFLQTKLKKAPIHVMKLTPEFKAHILEKGFPLFSVTPSFTPVSHDPFKTTPVDYNPDFT